MKDDPKSIARKSYQAYVDKDRAAIEAVLSEDFHFTSPLDNRLSRATYFDRCWKNSEPITGFRFVNLVSEGEHVDGMCPERICLFVVPLNDCFIMCSICLANLALIAVSVTSAAGLAALAARMDAALE